MSKVTITRRNFVKIGVVAGTLLAGGDIHFNLYVPEGVSGAAGQTAPATAGGRDLASSTAAGASSFAPPAPSASPNATMPAAFTDPEPAQPVALFVTLPGYQGLYFQGVGENLRTEDFGFEAQAYDPTMIVVAPQLSDWGETSARQTIALVEWPLRAYNIDADRVFLEGYSGGGETLSQIMGITWAEKAPQNSLLFSPPIPIAKHPPAALASPRISHRERHG